MKTVKQMGLNWQDLAVATIYCPHLTQWLLLGSLQCGVTCYFPAKITEQWLMKPSPLATAASIIRQKLLFKEIFLKPHFS